MKILAIFSSPCGLNGAAKNLGFTVKSLVEANHKVHILCVAPDGASRFLEACGATVLFCPIPLGMNTSLLLERSAVPLRRIMVQNAKDIARFVVGFIQSCRLIKSLNPDILFSIDITLPQCALAGMLMRRKVVNQVQAELIRGRWGIRRRALIGLFSRCHLLFGITQKHLAPFRGRSRERGWTEVIPNTVGRPDTLLPPADAELLGLPAARLVIGYFGGVSRNNGFEFLLEVARDLVSHGRELILVLAGGFNRRFSSEWSDGQLSGAYRETRVLFETVKECGLIGHCRIVGERHDVLSLMSCCHMVVVPHRLPHFSRPIIEAFAAGTPVVASDDDFNRDVISDGQTGLLAEYGNKDQWIAKILKLSNETALARELARSAETVYRERFAPQPMAQRVVECYERVQQLPYRKKGVRPDHDE